VFVMCTVTVSHLRTQTSAMWSVTYLGVLVRQQAQDGGKRYCASWSGHGHYANKSARLQYQSAKRTRYELSTFTPTTNIEAMSQLAYTGTLPSRRGMSVDLRISFHTWPYSVEAKETALHTTNKAHPVRKGRDDDMRHVRSKCH